MASCKALKHSPPPHLKLSGLGCTTYFNLNYISPYSTNYDASRAVHECKWTEVMQQLFSTQATRGSLMKTDFKTRADPFKNKPMPRPPPKKGGLGTTAVKANLVPSLSYLYSQKPSHWWDKMSTAAPNRKLQACH